MKTQLPHTLRSKAAMVALVGLFGSPAHAAPADVVREGSPGVPDAATAFASPSRLQGRVSERTGAFSYEYPIAVPPGRLAMEPTLGLRYSSDVPLAGGIAAGWTLGLPEIVRDESRALTNSDAWVSSHGRLVRFNEPGSTTGAATYRAWGDSTFTRYARVSADRWEERSADGRTNRFERVAQSRDDRFVLASSADRFGNTVRYSWTTYTGVPGWQAIELTSIEYTSNEAAGLTAHARVSFVYGDPVICDANVPPIGSRVATTADGLVLRDARPLTTVRTEVRDAPGAAFRTVREVTLAYAELRCNGTSARSPVRALSSIQERARSPLGDWTSMPPTSFQYGPLGELPLVERTDENFAPGSFEPMPIALAWGMTTGTAGNGSWDWDETHSMLIDLDGDGDQDRLVAGRHLDADGQMRFNPHCTGLVYRNLGGNRFTENAYPVWLPRLWESKYCTLTVQPKIPPFGAVPPTEPTVGNGEEVSISVSRYIDIDGDGLVDIVSAVFLPSGNEGGDDQRPHHPNCDPGVANPSWVVCGGPGDSVTPPVFPARGHYASQRRNQYYDGKYVWRWYRNTGAFAFDLNPRFIASPIPLDLVGTSRISGDYTNASDEFALADVTGDGVPDAVWTNPDRADWDVWIGDGAGGFQGANGNSPWRWTAPIGVESLRAVVHGDGAIPGVGTVRDSLMTSLLDVNQDGRPDLVTRIADGVARAYLNEGSGFESTGIPVSADDQGAHERLFGRFGEGLFRRISEQRLADLDGDSLLDSVRYAAVNSQGALHTGDGTLFVRSGSTAMEQARSLTGPRGIAASALHTTQGAMWFSFGEISDVDGDGYADLLGLGQLATLPLSADTEPPGLLTRINSGRDASTIITYARRADRSYVGCSWAETPARPCSGIGGATRRVVRDVTTWSDGRNGPATASYRYQDPVVTRDELGRLGFRGYARVLITEPNHGEVAGVAQRATRIADFDYSSDYRGLPTATRILDSQNRLLSLAEIGYARRNLAASLSVSLPIESFSWACRTRTGTLLEQETACRNDVGLLTETTWSPLVPEEPAWFADPDAPSMALASTNAAIVGPPPAFYYASTVTQSGIGAASGGPTRKTSKENLLSSTDSHYLEVNMTTTSSEVVDGTERMLAREELSYMGAPLFVPREKRTWIQGNEFATSLTEYDPATGVLLWTQRPEQYRLAPTVPDAQRVKATFGYDAFFLYPAIETNELGHVVHTTRDFGTGALTATMGPNAWPDPRCNGGCPPIAERTRIDIDGFGRPIRSWIVDERPGRYYELAVATTATYSDPVGTLQRVETARYQTLGDPSSAIRELIAIDGTGLVVMSTRFAAAAGTNPLDAVTSYSYDAAGALTSITKPDPANDTSWTTTRIEYDALGRETRRIAPDGASVAASFDGATVTAQDVPRPGDTDPGPVASSTVTHDEFGDVSTVVERDGGASMQTTYEHDGLGRARTITDPDGYVTRLEHDGAGRRTAVIRGERIWRFGYDHDSNQITMTAPYMSNQDPSRFVTSIVYDVLGRPRSRLQGIRDLTTLELERYGDGSATWQYDVGASAIGRLSEFSLSAGRDSTIRRVFGYDAHGNTKSESLTFSIWSRFSDTRNLARTFDALGRVTSVTHADGTAGQSATTIAYDYDPRGFPSAARWGTSNGTTLATLLWNRADNLVRRENPLHEQTWAYDSNGRLSSMEVRARQSAAAPWASVTSQGMTYFSANDVKTMTTSIDVPSQSASFREDWIFDYDDRHQLTGVSGPSYEGLFAYTPGGRLQHAFVDSVPSLDRDIGYTYSSPASGSDALATTGITPRTLYASDMAGNRTRRAVLYRPSTTTYRYDGGDRLREVKQLTGGGVPNQVYWYDPGGTRMFALDLDSAGQPTGIRLWFGETEIQYGLNGVTHTYAYVEHGGALGRVADRSEFEATFQNQYGHLLAAVDGDGAVVAGFTYSPHGELIRTLGSEAESFRRRFNGKEQDPTGLHYYGARYYDDVSMLWMQADPYYNVLPDSSGRNPRRANRYTFSANNPLRYVDPDGLEVYWVINTNGRDIDNRAARTRVQQIASSPRFNPKNDVVVSLYVPDLGKLETTVKAYVALLAPKYGYTREVFMVGHGAPGDGPIGAEPTSGPYRAEGKEDSQMTSDGWRRIDFNTVPDGTAQFHSVGCRVFPWLESKFVYAQPGFGWATGAAGWTYPSTSPTSRDWTDVARDAPVFYVGTNARSSLWRKFDSGTWEVFGTDNVEPNHAVSPSGWHGRAYVDSNGDTTITSIENLSKYFGP
jgi:RHS repeat-associated protein